MPMAGAAEGPAAEEHPHSYFMLWDWDGTLECITHSMLPRASARAGKPARPPRSLTVKAPKRLKKVLHA